LAEKYYKIGKERLQWYYNIYKRVWIGLSLEINY
jgi:hypothetical protein